MDRVIHTLRSECDCFDWDVVQLSALDNKPQGTPIVSSSEEYGKGINVAGCLATLRKSTAAIHS